jgi:NitT/TauT family transport system permease protein
MTAETKKDEKKYLFMEKIPLLNSNWKYIRSISVLTIVVLIWELIASLSIYPSYILPKFSSVIISIYRELLYGDLIVNSFYSVIRVLGGFFVGLLLAVPLGLFMGWSKIFESLVDPVIEVLRPIPPLAWIPLAVIWLGLGLTSTIFITFLGAFFPILLNTVYGVKAVDKKTVEFSQTLGASNIEVLYKVVIPSSLPSIFTGMRIAMGIAWMTVVAAEMIAAKYGLGYMIWYARNTFDTPLIMGGMITIGLLSIGMVKFLSVLENRMFSWRTGIIRG